MSWEESHSSSCVLQNSTADVAIFDLINRLVCRQYLNKNISCNLIKVDENYFWEDLKLQLLYTKLSGILILLLQMKIRPWLFLTWQVLLKLDGRNSPLQKLMKNLLNFQINQAQWFLFLYLFVWFTISAVRVTDGQCAIEKQSEPRDVWELFYSVRLLPAWLWVTQDWWQQSTKHCTLALKCRVQLFRKTIPKTYFCRHNQLKFCFPQLVTWLNLGWFLWRWQEVVLLCQQLPKLWVVLPIAGWAEPNKANVESFLLWAKQHTAFFILIQKQLDWFRWKLKKKKKEVACGICPACNFHPRAWQWHK